MEPLEANTHVFIVRIWRLPRNDETMPPQYRGMVEQVVTHQRRYFHTFTELLSFIRQDLACPDPGEEPTTPRPGNRWVNAVKALFQRRKVSS